MRHSSAGPAARTSPRRSAGTAGGHLLGQRIVAGQVPRRRDEWQGFRLTISCPRTLALPLVGRNRPSSIRMCGLARAVVAHEAEHLTMADRETHGVHCKRAAKGLGESVDLDCVTGFHAVVRVENGRASAVI